MILTLKLGMQLNRAKTLLSIPVSVCLSALLLAALGGCAGEGRGEPPENQSRRTDCAKVNGAFAGLGSSAASDTTGRPPASKPARTNSSPPETPQVPGIFEPEPPQMPDIFDGKVSQGELGAHSLRVGAADTLTVQMFWKAEAADVGLELEAPNGDVIDPSSARGSPSARYHGPGPEGPPIKGYRVPGPQAGTWTLRAIGEDVPAGSTSYVIKADLKGTDLKKKSALTASTKKEFYQSGEEITVEAKLRGMGSGLKSSSTGVSVQARAVRPDSSVARLTLLDDGTGADGASGDGVFAATLNETSPAGWYDFFVTAEGEAPGAPGFSRKAFTQVPVSSSTSGLTGSFGESTRDTDGDGLTDELAIEIGVRIGEAGRYSLSGRLTGSGGTFISSGAVDTTLPAGTHVLRLSFSGRRIYKSGLGGPYQLRRLSLAETESEVLPASILEDAYRTEPYARESFEHRPAGPRGRRARKRPAPWHSPEDLAAREYMEQVQKTVANLNAHAALSLAPEGVSSPERARSHVAACLLKRHGAADSIRVSSGGRSVRFYDTQQEGWLNIVWER